MPKKRRLPEGDDGRTIASMDVEGMPWSIRRTEDEAVHRESKPGFEPMSAKDTRKVAFAATLTALGIAMVFIVAGALLILFLTKVWAGY